MSRVKYENPFAMGNLDDLFEARVNNDAEYLKEWSEKAVKEYEYHRNIEMTAFQKLIDVQDASTKAVREIRDSLRRPKTEEEK